MNSIFSKEVSTGKGESWNFTSYFFCSPIFLDNVFDHIICLVNTDLMFTLDHDNVEDLYFWSLLEGILKDSV